MTMLFSLLILVGVIIFFKWDKFITRVDWVLYCVIVVSITVLKASQLEDKRRFDISQYTGSTGRSFTITGDTHGTNLSSHQSPSR